MADAKNNTMSPDEIEDRVLAKIPTLSVQELETICGLIDLDVPADKKGKKKEVRKLLSKELNKDTEDDNQGGWILIHDLLFPDPEKNPTVKVEPVAASDAGDTKNTKTSETQLEQTSRLESRQNESTERFVETRMKELKLSGTIGGPTSAKNMTYTSLLFEVNNARKSRCPDSVIILGIIKAIHPDNDAKEYLERSEDSSLDEVLQFIKNHCKQTDESGALYTQFQTARQQKNQKAIGFVTGLALLRKKVMALSIEKGTPHDENMLKKQFFHIMFTGLRSESLRSELREKVRGDWTMSDNKLLDMVREVSANEVERLEKFGELEDESSDNDVAVNAVSCKSKDVKKKKENPFERLEGLLVNQDKAINELRAQVMELQSKPQAAGSSFPNYDAFQFYPQQSPQQDPKTQLKQEEQKAQQLQQQLQQQQMQHQLQQNHLQQMQAFFSLRPKRRNECNNCWQLNADRCPHCFKCDGTDHKAKECTKKLVEVVPEGKGATTGGVTPTECMMCSGEVPVDKLKSCDKCKCGRYCSAQCLNNHDSHAEYCEMICSVERIENEKRMRSEIFVNNDDRLPYKTKLKLIRLVGERPLVKIRLNGVEVKGLWDTGAMISLINKIFLAKHFPDAKIESIGDFTGENFSLTAANQSEVRIEGVVVLEFGWESLETCSECHFW